MFQFFRNIRIFFKNIWDFRRELWNFRGYDWEFNLKMLERSLDVSAEFHRSSQALATTHRETADEIDKFLFLIQKHRNLTIRAEEYFNEHYPDFNNDPVEIRAELEKIEKIKRESWDEAFDYLRDNMQNWWD